VLRVNRPMYHIFNRRLGVVEHSSLEDQAPADGAPPLFSPLTRRRFFLSHFPSVGAANLSWRGDTRRDGRCAPEATILRLRKSSTTAETGPTSIGITSPAKPTRYGGRSIRAIGKLSRTARRPRCGSAMPFVQREIRWGGGLPRSGNRLAAYAPALFAFKNSRRSTPSRWVNGVTRDHSSRG